MAQGGYQRPSSPAPVSGPGAMSQRTDGGPGQPVRPVTGLPYGQAQQLQSIQQAAPMSASPGGTQAQPALAGNAALGGQLPATPFGAPTQQPQTPVTAGAALGPGAGVEALGLMNPQQQDMAQLIPYLPVLQHMANQPGSSVAARNLVRQIMAFAAGTAAQQGGQ